MDDKDDMLSEFIDEEKYHLRFKDDDPAYIYAKSNQDKLAEMEKLLDNLIHLHKQIIAFIQEDNKYEKEDEVLIKEALSYLGENKTNAATDKQQQIMSAEEKRLKQIYSCIEKSNNILKSYKNIIGMEDKDIIRPLEEVIDSIRVSGYVPDKKLPQEIPKYMLNLREFFINQEFPLIEDTEQNLEKITPLIKSLETLDNANEKLEKLSWGDERKVRAVLKQIDDNIRYLKAYINKPHVLTKDLLLKILEEFEEELYTKEQAIQGIFPKYAQMFTRNTLSKRIRSRKVKENAKI